MLLLPCFRSLPLFLIVSTVLTAVRRTPILPHNDVAVPIASYAVPCSALHLVEVLCQHHLQIVYVAPSSVALTILEATVIASAQWHRYSPIDQ